MAANASPGPLRAIAAEASEFPPGDEAFHTYAEVRADIQAVAAAHPSIVSWRDLPIPGGSTVDGHQIPIVKISDDVATDEAEPEVFFSGLTHAREHVTVEQSLALIHWLADGYGTDPRITDIVDSREIWIVPMVNPDGGEYDITDRTYHSWRKDREPNPGVTAIGTDLNRNYDYRWGCCGGSSGNPAAITYRGSAPFSTRETRALRDFVLSRRVGGRQQITSAISFHSYGQTILYPYGYTLANIPSDMTGHDWLAFTHLAAGMGARNGYRPVQESSMYITDGTFLDWAYGRERIFSFTFELYPSTQELGGFYPSASGVAAAVETNRDALLYFMEQADCPWRAAGATLAAADCGVFFDDLETSRGWLVDPLGTDTATATTGRWARGDAAASELDGPKQLAAAASGRGEYATGLRSGATAADSDLDGRTTVQTPAITLPAAAATLTFRYTFAHDAAASSADYLRVRVVHDGGQQIVWVRLGQPVDRDASWKLATVDLSAFAGMTVRIRFEAVDGGPDDLVEAAFDEVRVTTP